MENRDTASEEPAPTPAERLLYALGQLYRLWHDGELDVEPKDFDVMDLAGIIGVKGDIELVSEEPHATAYHFDGEVLVVCDSKFPWHLMDPWEWGTWGLLAEAARELEE